MGGEASKITGDELRTLRDSTSFSGDEIQDWYSKFRKDCPEGSMTREQFMSMYSQIFPNGDVRQFAEHIFKSYDIDGNGMIDFKEFLCTMSVASRGAIDEKLTWAFRLYDLDGNGYVTEKECVEIIKSIYKMRGMSQKASKGNLTPQEATEEIFKQLDRDNDKKLTEFEFVQGAKNSPSILGILQNV